MRPGTNESRSVVETEDAEGGRGNEVNLKTSRCDLKSRVSGGYAVSDPSYFGVFCFVNFLMILEQL